MSRSSARLKNELMVGARSILHRRYGGNYPGGYQAVEERINVWGSQNVRIEPACYLVSTTATPSGRCRGNAMIDEPAAPTEIHQCKHNATVEVHEREGCFARDAAYYFASKRHCAKNNL
jgi:hypothetical protein